MKKSHKLKVFSKMENYLNKKSSIEFILGKLLEFEKSKFALFSNDEILGMKLINKPDIKNIFGDPLSNEIQEMWRKNEFRSKITNQDLKDIEQSISSSNPNNLTNVQKNIIKLLE